MSECKTDAEILQRKAGAIVYDRPVQSGHQCRDKHCTVDQEVAVCIRNWENRCRSWRTRDELWQHVCQMVPMVLKFHQARKWGFINMLTTEIPVVKQVELTLRRDISWQKIWKLGSRSNPQEWPMSSSSCMGKKQNAAKVPGGSKSVQERYRQHEV